jgi:TfoX/Sxy family transcriptional regulator of competence genes
MATTSDFIEYVCEQIEGSGAVRYKKMFGEYMVYVDDKPILLVCDNTVFVKILPATDALCTECDKGFPYGGAKEHYILDVDDADLLKKAVAALEPVTPLPKAKKGK